MANVVAGGYAGSWTWFQVGLLRDGEEVGERYDVQRNIVAGQYYKEHKTVLDASHPLLKEARDGDRIVLWVRAMYPVSAKDECECDDRRC